MTKNALGLSYVWPRMRRIRPRVGHDLKRLNFRVSPRWLAAVDRWRAQQPGIPNRSEAIRILVEWAVEHYPKTTPFKAPKK